MVKNTTVVLRVFDIGHEHKGNQFLSYVGLGTYHTSLIICGRDYSFSDQGITASVPSKTLQGVLFKEDIVLGEFHSNSNDVNGIVARLRQDFNGHQYHLVKHNCNHFTSRFCRELLGIDIPRWVNRAAFFGSWFFPTSVRTAQNPKMKNTTVLDRPRPELSEKQKHLLAKLKKDDKSSGNQV